MDQIHPVIADALKPFVRDMETPVTARTYDVDYRRVAEQLLAALADPHHRLGREEALGLIHGTIRDYAHQAYDAGASARDELLAACKLALESGPDAARGPRRVVIEAAIRNAVGRS